MMNDLISLNEASTTWVENLALEELNMDESGVVNFNNHLNPSHLLEESSISFVNELRDRFEFYIIKFNQFRSKNSSDSQIRIFKISNTVNDFILFRNSLRLVIARKANDLISVGFLSNSGELFSARLDITSPVNNVPHEIRAHLGPFHNISWRFQGEVIEIDSLVKHYLSEFIRNSAR